MRLLLFDTTAYYPSSPLFLEALQELSALQRGDFQFTFVDEAHFRRAGQSLGAWLGRFLPWGSPLDRPALNRALLETARSFQPDLILICKGAAIAPETLAQIKRATGAVLVNYATDDPFNPRVNSRDLVQAIPCYDLYACTKLAIVTDVIQAGCATATYVPFAYKPSVHFPEPPRRAEEHRRFDSDVAFIGGYDRDRAPLFKALIKAIPSLKLALYGSFWNRSPTLRRYWRGFALGRDFRMAVGGSKIALNLVRKANRDGHVMRSFELPACRGFMLAERTTEHQRLFVEDRDAAYFASPEELVEKIKRFLGHEDERAAIAFQGRNIVLTGGHTYRDRLHSIIASADTLFHPALGVAPQASAVPCA